MTEVAQIGYISRIEAAEKIAEMPNFEQSRNTSKASIDIGAFSIPRYTIGMATRLDVMASNTQVEQNRLKAFLAALDEQEDQSFYMGKMLDIMTKMVVDTRALNLIPVHELVVDTQKRQEFLSQLKECAAIDNSGPEIVKGRDGQRFLAYLDNARMLPQEYEAFIIPMLDAIIERLNPDHRYSIVSAVNLLDSKLRARIEGTSVNQQLTSPLFPLLLCTSTVPQYIAGYKSESASIRAKMIIGKVILELIAQSELTTTKVANMTLLEEEVKQVSNDGIRAFLRVKMWTTAAIQLNAFLNDRFRHIPVGLHGAYAHSAGAKGYSVTIFPQYSPIFYATSAPEQASGQPITWKQIQMNGYNVDLIAPIALIGTGKPRYRTTRPVETIGLEVMIPLYYPAGETDDEFAQLVRRIETAYDESTYDLSRVAFNYPAPGTDQTWLVAPIRRRVFKQPPSFLTTESHLTVNIANDERTVQKNPAIFVDDMPHLIITTAAEKRDVMMPWALL